MINYAKEVIPSRLDLIEKSNNLTKKALSLKPLGFRDMFKAVDYKGKIENHRIEEFWKPLYNNRSKSEYLDGKIVQSLKPKNEVKGIYIFYENDQPIYVGISRKIIQRLRNHFSGQSHNEASLVYLILRNKHDNSEKGLYMGNRAELPEFKSERKSFQAKMINEWKVAILPISDNYALYTTEVLLACELQTKWNSFQTH